MRATIVHYASGLDYARPANDEGNTVSTFPACILLTTEGSGAAVGPAHGFRAVVAGEDDDRVVRDTEVVELLQEHADVVVELGHAGAVEALLIDHGHVLGRQVRPDMHAGGVVPDEERLARLDGAVDVIQRRGKELVVDRLHSFLGEWAGILAHLLAPRAEAWIGRRGIIGGCGFALEDATRPELGSEAGVLRIIDVFRLLLGIQVIEVAEELVEAVHRGQKFVAIAKMVLAILEGHVAKRLEQLGEGGILFLKADRRAGQPDLGQPGANRALPGNKRGAPRRAALLRVVVGEQRAFVSQPVNVGCLVMHHAQVVGTDIPVADVIAEDDEDIWLLRACCLRMRGRTAADKKARESKRSQRYLLNTCTQVHTFPLSSNSG